MRQHYCGKCGLQVYFAELLQAAGRFWHTRCFRCANSECGRFMDSRSYNDHEEQLYCNHCYKNLFGPKGVGYGIGAGVLCMASSKSVLSEQTGFDTGAIVTSSIFYHDEKKIQKPGYIEHIDETFPDKNEVRHLGAAERIERGDYGTTKFNQASSCNTSKDRTNATASIATNCSKCSKKVYDAEKVLAGGMAWHRHTCFVCENCKKVLEPRTVRVRSNLLYCNSCYAREFASRGYGACTSPDIVRTYELQKEL